MNALRDLHGAAEWLLRIWNEQTTLREIDQGR